MFRLCLIGVFCATSFAATACHAQNAPEDKRRNAKGFADNTAKPNLTGPQAEGALSDPVPEAIYRPCTVRAVPQTLRMPPFSLSDFYQKYCNARGIPVVGSERVRDDALVAAHQRVFHMSSNAAHRQSMINNRLRVAIMAQSEVTTDIPEHSDLNVAFPETDWNVYRGLGATFARPAVSGAEENLLGLPGDIYAGEDILVHEFAHGLHELGISPVEGSFDIRLQASYADALNTGLWRDTYAATNPREYWAEAVQSWYSRNQEAVPTDGIHNDVDTRAELVDYDRSIADLIKAYLPEQDFPQDVY